MLIDNNHVNEKLINDLFYGYSSSTNLFETKGFFFVEFSIIHKNIFGARYLEKDRKPSNINPYIFHDDCLLKYSFVTTRTKTNLNVQILVNESVIENIYLDDQNQKYDNLNIYLNKTNELSCLINTQNKIENISIYFVCSFIAS